MPRAVAMAQEVLALRRIREPEQIDLLALLADHRIVMRRAHLGNAEGRLVRSGRHGVMTIDEAAFASEKWVFVAAHELGHFLLHEYLAELACFPKRGATREEKSRSFLDEEAASGFGVELLLPTEMVRPRCDPGATPMERARSLAETFGVSLPTAALRVLDFTEEPCAVVYAERGKVAWCTATKAFGVKVKKGAVVPEGSGAGDAREKADARARERGMRASAWGVARGGVEEIREHAVAIPGFDAVVTVLRHAG